MRLSYSLSAFPLPPHLFQVVDSASYSLRARLNQGCPVSTIVPILSPPIDWPGNMLGETFWML
jgi:hypothetical protein